MGLLHPRAGHLRGPWPAPDGRMRGPEGLSAVPELSSLWLRPSCAPTREGCPLAPTQPPPCTLLRRGSWLRLPQPRYPGGDTYSGFSHTPAFSLHTPACDQTRGPAGLGAPVRVTGPAFPKIPPPPQPCSGPDTEWPHSADDVGHQGTGVLEGSCWSAGSTRTVPPKPLPGSIPQNQPFLSNGLIHTEIGKPFPSAPHLPHLFAHHGQRDTHRCACSVLFLFLC